jgi:dynein heavy chain, axonemal
MGRLNSVSEQLRMRECKVVLGVLNAARSRSLRQWKALENAVTDSANEAKDNVKYLVTLEKFIEPLYNGAPLVIIDSLPGSHRNVTTSWSRSSYIE